MKMLKVYQIEEEVANKIKKQTEFVYFFVGNPYEEKLYIIPNYKATNSESFLIELNNFLENLPLILLDRLSIHNFVVTRFKEDNLSINITKQKDNYSLNLYKNDLIKLMKK